MGSDAKEIVRREGRSEELPSKRGLRFVIAQPSSVVIEEMRTRQQQEQEVENGIQLVDGTGAF